MNDQLRDLLAEAGTDLRVDPGTADRTWREARRRDRRGRIVGVSAVALAAGLAIALVAAPWPGRDSAGPVVTTPDSPTATPDEEGPDQQRTERFPQPPRMDPDLEQEPLWGQMDVASLNTLDTGLPAVIDLDAIAASAVPLEQDPVDAAVAVVTESTWFTRYVPLTSWEGVEMFVLGDDGGWRRITATELGYTGDPQDANGLLMDTRSLSDDGTMFATSDERTGELVVLDLTSAAVSRLQTPLEAAIPPRWTPDGEALITQAEYDADSATVQVDVATGRVSDVPYNLFDFDYDAQGRPVQLVSSRSGTGPELMVFGPDGDTRRIPLQMRLPRWQGLDIDEVAVLTRFASPSWRYNGSRAGFLVVDPETGEPLAQLPTRSSDYWTVLAMGWIDDDTLLLLDVPQGVLVAWTYTTGERRLVSTASEAVSAVFATDLLD